MSDSPSLLQFDDAWRTPPELGITSQKCESIAAPKVASFRLAGAKLKFKIVSFTFPEAPQQAAPLSAKPPAETKSASAAEPAPGAEKQTATRLKPPADVVKLEDRLYYLLQPPLESLFATGELKFPFQPFPYQMTGIAFLYPRVAAVLADEMGLGKTMQAITAIRLLLHAREIQSVALVCPKPLVTNWKREFSQWAPELPLGIIEGDQTRRHWQWQQPQTPVKIANYEVLMRDFELFGQTGLNFDLVVLDEAQRIKNRGSTTSRIARSIARKRSWALTGTPVENSPEDLIGIFEFVAPGHLHESMQPRRLGKLAHDYIIRRTKSMVLADMPPKLFRDAEIDLTAEQRETYRQAEEEGVLKLTNLGPGITIQHVFELVLRLKQICNFDPASGASAKLERLEADLEEVAASGKKAIVFSQWVHTIKNLSKNLGRFHPLEYHGQIPSAQRDGVIQRFKEDPKHSVILMSYGAGAVGLNLQFCHYVFLFDRWWNPAVEDQAINRAHRIGVTGPVTVSRFISSGTIEERINQVLEEKRELFETILSQDAGTRKMHMTHDDIFGLFNIKVAKAA